MGDSTKISGLKMLKRLQNLLQDLEQTNASNYAYSAWFYIDDWSYRYGEPKIVLGRLDSDLNPSPSIVLGAIENNLRLKLLFILQCSSTGSTHTCNVCQCSYSKMG